MWIIVSNLQIVCLSFAQKGNTRASMHGDRSVLYAIGCFSRQQKGESCLDCLCNQGLRRIHLLGSYICEKEINDPHKRAELWPLTTLAGHLDQNYQVKTTTQTGVPKWKWNFAPKVSMHKNCTTPKLCKYWIKTYLSDGRFKHLTPPQALHSPSPPSSFSIWLK